MRKVVGIGETIMDILFQQNQPVAAVPGGSVFNSIISLGRTTTPSVFIGYAGGDIVGQQIADYLQENGVCADFFELRKDEKTAVSLAYLNEQGDANYVFYKETPCADDSMPLPTMAADDVLLFGSFYASCPGSRPQVSHMLREAKRAASIVYYDLNFRKSYLPRLNELMPTLLENFQFSNIVRGSADDFAIMYDERDARTIYKKYIAKYCPIFICTSGPGLVTICTPSLQMDFPVAPVKTVSTVGAGDNFNAGFIYALLRDGVKMDDLATLSAEQWTRLVETGCGFAAQVCQSHSNNISPEYAKSLKK